MKWAQPLTEAILLKRYKRFLADCTLDSSTVTVHVPNTGSMTSCWEPNWKCAVSKSDNLSRKLPYTLELIHNGQTWIGVNTANANKLVKHWLEQGLLEDLSGYSVIKPEMKVGESRLDFYLSGHPGLPDCFIEVKNVTLKLDGVAQFPDAVSTRGQKHLQELASLRKEGYRTVMLYVVQREDVESMRPAVSIDKEYSRLLQEAAASGVEILVYQCKMGLDEIKLGKKIPFHPGT